MKVILDIKDNSRAPFIMEMLKGLKSVKVVKEVKEKRKSQLIADLAGEFNDIKSHQEGKLKLKSAKDLLNEL